jgi:hypothetical protein
MSWLTKIVSKFGKENPEQLVEEVPDAVTTAQCLTAESISPSEPATDGEDENPTKQRRYFVKKGLYVDHEAETPDAQTAEAAEEIPDRHPVDLKTLFPKLSLR